MDHIKKTLDAFLAGESKVLVIKGAWGVGKTYFWEKYIAERIEKKDLSHIAYSYLSLFGASSLEDLRKQVFHKTKTVSDDNRIEKAFESKFAESIPVLSKIPWFKNVVGATQKSAPQASQVSKILQEMPIIGKHLGVISTLEYALVENYIVCIDDIERKAEELSITDVMGLVDELAHQKSCKVILIFNEDELGESDKPQFEKYREKIVDHEIHYNPTSKENLAYIFDTKAFSRYAVLEDTVCKLEIKNIRILRNIKNVCDVFHRFINGKDNQIIDEFILHTTLLSKIYYDADKELTYDIFRKYIPADDWRSKEMMFSDKNKEEVWYNKYKALTEKIDFARSLFDGHIDFFLKNGYIESEDALIQSITKLEENIKVNSVQSKISRAWAIYGDSFKDNYDEFKSAMVDILDNEMERLDLGTCASILEVLASCGEDITSYIERYFELNAGKLCATNAKEIRHYEWKHCNKLFDKIAELNKSNKVFDTDDILLHFANTQSYNHEDTDYLNSLSVDDYKKWMQSNPDDMPYKIRKGLLAFGGEIANKTTEALKLIAAEPSKNNFNAFRIKKHYNIE